MNSGFTTFLFIVLTIQNGLALSPAQASANDFVALCKAAEKALQAAGPKGSDFSEAERTIKTQCAVARLSSYGAIRADSARACNDIKYELNHRWRLSPHSREALLAVLAEHCRLGASRK